MDGIAFGKQLKNLRHKTGIPSKELSKKAGKAVTYVSQLERGLIKKPDYTTCHNILEILEVETDKIDDILSYYGIISPEREQNNLKWAIEKAEESLNFDWIEQSSQKLKQVNKKLHESFNMLIDKDLSRAERLISNINSLTADKEKFDFLYSLFYHDLSYIDSEDRIELLVLINNYVLSKYNYDEYGELCKSNI